MKSVHKLLAALATTACVVGLLTAWRYGWNFGAAAGPAASVMDADTWRPSRVPDRIVLTWTKDPVHTQAVTWRTSTSSPAEAQVTPDDGGPLVATKATRVKARTTPLTSDLATAYNHTA